MSDMIHYGKHYIDDNDIQYVEAVLKSDYITTGPIIERFELDLRSFTGYRYCSCVNSGTAALHCALFAAGIKENDEVIIPTMTFVATSNAVLYQRAIPILCDIEEDTLLIDIESVKKLITKKTKAIIAVDYAGQQCDYKELRKICNKYNLILISDAAHSFGAIQNIFDRKILPDLTCYSFHPVKHITTGEGGAVLTNNKGYDEKIKQFRNHGRHYNTEISDIGYNYRMPAINAALGRSQLNKYFDFLERRLQIAKKYDKYFEDIKVKDIGNRMHVYHLYVIKVKTINRGSFKYRMVLDNISCQIHYIPIYDHKLFNHINKNNYPNTEKVKDEIISIPIFYTLTDEQQDYIIKCIRKNLVE